MEKRIIKFRAWVVNSRISMLGAIHEAKSEMIYDILNLSKENLEQHLPFDDCDSIDFEQYTGFKSRKGVEVYEGDIVADDDKVGIVIFYNGCFMVSFNHIEVESKSFGASFVQGKTFDRYWDDDLTPLGNIHEHDIKEVEKEYNKKRKKEQIKSQKAREEYLERKKKERET